MTAAAPCATGGDREPPRAAEIERIAEYLRRGRAVEDEDFDRVYSDSVRRFSCQFWTPVKVAMRAAQLLCEPGAEARVLDVGAGVAKMCAIGALTTPATFTGVERRPHLVAAGRRALESLGAENAKIVQGTLHDIRWADYDAYYLFNPFEENLYATGAQIDQTVPLTAGQFRRDVAAVEAALRRAKTGTRVVTYNGFGGKIPYSYKLRRAETWGLLALRLWVKADYGVELSGGWVEATISDDPVDD